MNYLILSLVFLFSAEKTLAGNFVDSLAKEYGKENGCYSISLNDKKSKNSKNSYTRSYTNKNSQELKKIR